MRAAREAIIYFANRVAVGLHAGQAVEPLNGIGAVRHTGKDHQPLEVAASLDDHESAGVHK
jgi:hypothetical protein